MLCAVTDLIGSELNLPDSSSGPQLGTPRYNIVIVFADTATLWERYWITALLIYLSETANLI